MISIRRLALKLGADPKIVQGIAFGLKIEADRQPKGHYFSDSQAERIEKRWDEIRPKETVKRA